MQHSVNDRDRYKKYGSESEKQLAQLNMDTWFVCKAILTNSKSYECEVSKKEIDTFLNMLQYSFDGSDFRKVDGLSSLLNAGILLTPIKHLAESKLNELTKLIEPALAYYKENDHLWNKEPPL